MLNQVGTYSLADRSEFPQPTTKTSFLGRQSRLRNGLSCLQSPYHSKALFPLSSKKPSQNLTDLNSSNDSGTKALVMKRSVDKSVAWASLSNRAPWLDCSEAANRSGCTTVYKAIGHTGHCSFKLASVICWIRRPCTEPSQRQQSGDLEHDFGADAKKAYASMNTSTWMNAPQLIAILGCVSRDSERSPKPRCVAGYDSFRMITRWRKRVQEVLR